MSHRVAYAEERVSESHTCEGGSVCHFLSRFRVVSAEAVSSGQIVEYKFGRLERETVCIVGSHHGSDSFECVSESVDTGSAGQSLGDIHHEISVDYRHIGKQFVVCERIFSTRLFVGYNCERGHFTTRTCGGRDSYEISLVAHMREGVYPLSDIHKSHSEILEVDFGMLVKRPHYLTCVHCGAAADSDYDVRLERRHSLCAFLSASESRVRSYVVESRMNYAHLVQSVCDSLCEAALVEEGIGYDKRLLLIHNVFEFSESDAQTTLLEINLFGCSEPQHILSPFRDRLDIDKMFNAYVFADAVTAPAAAAQREGGSQFEVVQVADTALRRRSVDKDTARLHSALEFFHLVFARLDVDVKHGSVSHTAVRNEFARLSDSVVEIFSLVHSENGAEFFVSEFL